LNVKPLSDKEPSMKFRPALLAVSLSLALAACSFASDITPPPAAMLSNSALTAADATQASQPTLTATQTAVSTSTTPEASTTPASSTAPAIEATPLLETDMVTINGKVTLPPGGTLPSGTIATLLIFDTTTQQVEDTVQSPINQDNSYEFADVGAASSSVFLVSVEYNGVTYDSDILAFDANHMVMDLPITVYASSDDLSVLSITQTHLQFDFSTAGQVQVVTLYMVVNPGQSTVIVPSDGSSVPFIQIPDGAQNVNYQLAQSSSPLLKASDGFALMPGTDKQYGIITVFTLPYTGRMVYSQMYKLPVSAATVIVPEGVKVRSDQLTDAGTQTASGTTYHLWQGNSLASGSTLTLTISGNPGDKPGFVLDQRTMIMIGVGVVGAILIALGVFLFIRERRLRKMEDDLDGNAEYVGNQDISGNTRESVLDAIIALEDRYKAGDITREAFEKRRDELKAQLASLV
jgi:hypothetical protein